MAHKILVVDDDAEISGFVSKMLIKNGYEVVVASDGEEGLRKVEEEHPDVVLLDLMMPKLNGFEVLKGIRQKYKKWIPVIITSGQSDLESVRQSYSLEADHYLTKPCSMENILTGVRTMISLIPLRQQES